MECSVGSKDIRGVFSATEVLTFWCFTNRIIIIIIIYIIMYICIFVCVVYICVCVCIFFRYQFSEIK